MRSLVIGLTVLTVFSFGAVLLEQDFNSAWTTGSPPAGWRIFHTGPAQGTDDWHREEAYAAPWTTNPSRYAAIFWNLYPDPTPDTLITEPIDCSGYRNVTLYVTTFFRRQLSNPYTALLCYSTDGGATFTTIRDYHDQNVDSVAEVFVLEDARNQPNVVIAWVYSGNLAYINWWCIDDVRVEAEQIPDYDIACERIIEPAVTIQPGDMSPSARFYNNGLNNQSNIPVACSLYDNAGAGLTEWYDIIPSLPAGESISVSFSPPYTFAGPQDDYYIKFWCAALLDDNRTNDTLDRTFDVTYIENLSYCSGSPSSYVDWPVGHHGYGVRFSAGASYPVYLESAKVYLDCPASPEHCRYQLAVYKEPSGGGPGVLYSRTPVLYGTDGWNSVFMADTGEQLVFPDGNFYLFYLQVGEPPESPRLGVDGTLNNQDRCWQYRAGTVMPDTPPGDFMIRASVNHAAIEDPGVDARTLFVDEPWYDFVQRPFDKPITPKALVENLSTLDNFSNLIVTCSIFGESNVLRYWDAIPIEGLPNGADTMVSFRAWVPEVAERCSVIVRSLVLPLIEPDTIPQNDDKRFTVDIVKGVHSGSSPLQYGWIDSDTTDGPTFSWVDTAGADVAIASGDEARIFVPIGFNFPHYDTTYNFVYVCTNGWLAFGPDQGVNESVPAILPSPLLPNRAVYPWWDNLAVGPQYGGGRVYFRNDGASPNRRFTVIWQDAWRVRPDGDTSDRISFEAVLHENGSILFQYKDVTAGNLNFDNARYAGIGIENKDGGDGLCYLYARPPMSSGVNDLGNRVAPGRAIRFARIFRDAAALAITSPETYIFPGPVVPAAKIQNAGTVRDTIRVYMKIRPGDYDDSVLVTDLRPGDDTLVTFRPCTLALGTYKAVCSTAMRGDTVETNNVVLKEIIVSPWIQRDDVPFGWYRRKIKSASLVFAPTTRRLYAMKGSNSNELWYFDLATGEWNSLTSMPLDSSGKKAKDGCDLAFDPIHGTRGYLWAIKGGGRTDFYAYDIARDTWLYKKPVYIGNLWQYRPPKKGAAIVFVHNSGPEGTVYCIPGNNSNLMYYYDVATDVWAQAPDMPTNPTRQFARCRHGADMVFDGDSFFYAMRGSNTLDVYAYSPLARIWVDTLNPVGLLGPRLKRVKAGASMACFNKTLFLLKGGNTQEFWSYAGVAGDSWIQHTGIPIALYGRHRKVKRGSAMAAAESTIYCLKGSYSNEFWEYKPTSDSVGVQVLGPRPERSGVMAGESGALRRSLSVAPNPARTGLSVRYTIPHSSHVRLQVYDRAGRLTRKLYDAPALTGHHSLCWNATDDFGRWLAPGVYILRLENAGQVLTRKLVIQD